MTEFKFGPEHVGQTFKRRDGQVVEIVAHVPRAKEDYRIAALHSDGRIYSHCENGRYAAPVESERDIMPPLRTYFIAVAGANGQYWASGLYDSEQAARQAAGGPVAATVTVELP